MYHDEEDDSPQPDGNHDHDAEASEDLSIYQIRTALSRSYSDLEARQARESWQELESLAMGDAASDERPGESKEPAKSGKIDPEAVNLLLKLVQTKMASNLGCV